MVVVVPVCVRVCTCVCFIVRQGVLDKVVSDTRELTGTPFDLTTGSHGDIVAVVQVWPVTRRLSFRQRPHSCRVWALTPLAASEFWED